MGSGVGGRHPGSGVKPGDGGRGFSVCVCGVGGLAWGVPHDDDNDDNTNNTPKTTRA